MTGLAKRERSARWPVWFTQGLPEWWRSLEPLDLADWRDRDAMRLEEYRDNGTLVVKAEMPGIDPEKDVEITVDRGVLTISARREEQHEEKDEDKGSYRSEFRYGSFVRRLPLPDGASDEDVAASYKDGILEVRLPVKDEVGETKKIPVARG